MGKIKHYGDITKILGNQVEPVDIITGGSPCQDLSVAGKRAGLAGARSGLFMEQIRIIKEMRENDRANGRTDEHIRPRYMVWENVPGAFSSNKGEDFRAVLEETAKVAKGDACIPGLEGGARWPTAGCIMGDGWSIAWRLHDAQFWGVPQRRKRIALVADFGGNTAPEILFERKSLSGDTAESGEKGQDTATTIRCSVAPTSRAFSFQERAGRPGGGKGILIQDEHTGALSTLNNQSVCYGICSDNSNSMKSSNPYSGIYEAETARTLDLNGGNPSCNQGGIAVLMSMQAIGEYKDAGVASALKQRDYKDATDLVVAYGIDRAAFNQGQNAKYDFSIDEEKVSTCIARGPNGVFQSVVRRLTPMECERLQGFPDYWTDIGEWVDSKGKKHKDADSPRYKALGNSIALPFWQWMAEKMVRYIKNPTMASLFDGIGGFPLVFSRAGCEPIWASEIEEFPIAITKLRFSEAQKNNLC